MAEGRQPGLLLVWDRVWFHHQLWQLQPRQEELRARRLHHLGLQRLHCCLRMRRRLHNPRIQGTPPIPEVSGEVGTSVSANEIDDFCND